MLHLEYRKVAQSNIDQFDRVAAFKGAKIPKYHYKDETACAIGVHDQGRLLENQSSCIASLLHHEQITVDDFQRIAFIQFFHDYKFVPPYGGKSLSGLMDQKNVEIPPSVVDMVEGIKTPNDLTPEIYKEVMHRLATE